MRRHRNVKIKRSTDGIVVAGSTVSMADRTEVNKCTEVWNGDVEILTCQHVIVFIDVDIETDGQ